MFDGIYIFKVNWYIFHKALGYSWLKSLYYSMFPIAFKNNK